MTIFQKLSTLIRGSARQSTQVLLDANAVTIFEQEIVDVERSIQQRKKVLNEVIVARKQVEQEISSIRQLMDKRRSQASRLMEDSQQQGLIEDIAMDLAQQENLLGALEAQHHQLETKADAMSAALRNALSETSRHRRELRMAKAQQLRASSLAKANHLPEQLSELEQTRTHIQGLQDYNNDSEAAWSETEEQMQQSNIDHQVKKAGKDEMQLRAKEILASLRTESSSTTTVQSST